MSKYLTWLIVFAVATVVGAFYFAAQLKGLALPFLVWVPVALFTAALGGVQWKVYSDTKHPGKADALYARFIGMPLDEFTALTNDAKAQLKESVDRIRAQASRTAES